jgi:uncharacterized membrane protein YGL010W
MKSLEQQMAIYTAYHRNPWNRLTHFVGVPVIIFSILIPMAWLRLPFGVIEITGAAVFVAAVLVYYYLLDVPLAIAMTAFIVPVVYGAEWVTRMPWQTGLAVFLATFVGGWALQLAGHVLEGRRPALADNLFQIFVAPIFLVAETAFALGLRRGTQEEVNRLSHQYNSRP